MASERTGNRGRLVVAPALVALLACGFLPPSASPAEGAPAGLRDPLRPPPALRSDPGRVAGNVGARDWVLGSTLVAGERKLATINGRVVSTGEQVDGARVIDIEPGMVRLQSDNILITIRSSDPDIRDSRRTDP